MRHEKYSSIGKIISIDTLYKTRRTIKEIVLHCTATSIVSKCDSKDVDKMHKSRWGGTSGIGYHYLVRLDGTVEKGRWSDYPGAHAKGRNAYSLGIVYEGGLNTNGLAIDDILPSRQREVLIKLLKKAVKLYNVPIIGHKELPFVNKACPCMDMGKLRLQVL